MKNFTKVFFCLMLLLNYCQLETYAQDGHEFSSGNITLVQDSLIIDKQKINELEKKIQRSLPQDLKPQVKISDGSIDSRDDGKTDATTRTIFTQFDLTEIGINRFIATQSFPPVSGTFPGTNITYTASISRPYVTVRNGSMRANFTIYVSTSENNNYVIPVSPYLTIDLSYIYLTDIRAWMINFPTLINGLNIPQMIKDMIIEKYNTMNLVIYPGKILDEANNFVPPYLNIWISDFIIGFQCMDRVMRLNLGVEVNAEPQYFHCQWMKRGVGQLSLRFYGGVKTTLKTFQVVVGEDHYIYDVNMNIEKGEWTPQIDHTEYACVCNFFIKALFVSPYGEYVRVWLLGFNTATYNTWFDTNYRGGLN